MSAPFVSGVIALMLEANPSLGSADAGGLPHEKVRQILAATAEDRGAPGLDSEYGHGVIDAYSAIAEAAGSLAYVPNAYPGYTRLSGESVADNGTWTHQFTVTSDLLGLPIAGTATIEGEVVQECVFVFLGTCIGEVTYWSPDLELVLERESSPGSWSPVTPGSGEISESLCPSAGECGGAGRAELVHFIPQSTGSYRFRVYPATDQTNQGQGGGVRLRNLHGRACAGGRGEQASRRGLHLRLQ